MGDVLSYPERTPGNLEATDRMIVVDNLGGEHFIDPNDFLFDNQDISAAITLWAQTAEGQMTLTALINAAIAARGAASAQEAIDNIQWNVTTAGAVQWRVRNSGEPWTNTGVNIPDVSVLLNTHNLSQNVHSVLLHHHNSDGAAHPPLQVATNAVEASLDNHIAHHPGGTVPGPPAANSVGRDQLTASLRTDVDSHADQTALDATNVRVTNLEARNEVDAATEARIPSAGGNANQVWKKGPQNEDADWRDDAQGSDVSGLDQAQVDARVQAAAADTAPGNTPGTAAVGTSMQWAREDHDHGVTIGTGGLTEAEVDARVRAGVQDQAETGDTSVWPADKLDLTGVQAELDQIHQQIAHGEHAGTVTEVTGVVSPSYRATFTIPQTMRDEQGSYNAFLDISGRNLNDITAPALPADTELTYRGTGSLASSVPERTISLGRGHDFRHRFTLQGIEVTDAEGAIRCDLSYSGGTNNLVISSGPTATFTLVDEAGITPSDTAPGNTPGAASAGTSEEYSRGDHDHGITPGMGGAGLNEAQVDARVQAAAADTAPGNTPGTAAVGTSTQWAREDHDHGIEPGMGGGQPITLSGNTIETLYNNMPSTETALSYTAGSVDWSKSFDLDLGRALTEADDAKDLRIRFRYNQNTNHRTVDTVVNVGEFRSWTEFTTATGTAGVPVGNQKFHMSYGNAAADDLDGIWNRQGMLFRRGDSSGNHVLGIIVPAGNNAAYVALSEFRAIVQLVPPISALEVSGTGAGLTAAQAARLLPEAQTTDAGQVAKVQADGTWALGNDEGGTGSTVTANPVPDATAELETLQIGNTVFQVQVGRQAYIGGATTYTAASDTFTTNISADAIREPRLGDTVIFQLPDSFDSNADALTLAVVYDSGTASHPLENSHGVAVATNELMGGSTLEAVLVLPDGTNRKWRMIEPPIDLTQAQVEDRTSTLFGVVSGQRLAQSVDSFVENFARTNSIGKVPFNRLPDLVVFKSGSRPPASGEQGANDDRVSGEHVLWWDTDTNHMYAHDGTGSTMWDALTFGSATFLVGSGTPTTNTGTPGSVFMEITRDGDGNITNWYVWTKNDSNVWVNRFEVPIQSDADLLRNIQVAFPEQTGSGSGVKIVHTGNVVDLSVNREAGLFPILPDQNGTLRLPNFTEWIRKTPGFDAHGNQYIPKRRFTGATGGTVATIADGAFVTRNSVTYRFRGFHHADSYVTSPMFRHVYFTLTGSSWSANVWRTYVATDAWETTLDPFGHHTTGGRAVYRGIAVDDDAALHDAGTVGDIYVVGDSSAQSFELKQVTALPTAGTPEYYWELVHAATGPPFMEVADQAAALAASSANDPTVYWWEN